MILKIEQRIDTQISILVLRIAVLEKMVTRNTSLCLDDHSRVHLHTSPSGADYINANHVDVCMPSVDTCVKLVAQTDDYKIHLTYRQTVEINNSISHVHDFLSGI